MNLFKNLLFFGLLCLTTNAIYDDQYGLDDWHVQSIGKIKRAISSEQENSKKISQNFYVLSTSNILASISARNSELQWRNVESENLIDFLKVQNYLFVIGENTYTIYDLNGRILSRVEHNNKLSSQSLMKQFGNNKVLVHDPETGKSIVLENIKGNLNLLKSREISSKGSTVDIKYDDETEDFEIFSIGGVTVYKTSENEVTEIASIPCENAQFTSNHKIVYSCESGGSGVIDLESLQSTAIQNDEKIENLKTASDAAIFGHSEGFVYKIENTEIIKKPISGKILNIHVSGDYVYVFYQAKRSIDGLMKVATFDTVHLIQTNLKEIEDFTMKGFGNVPENVIIDEFVSKNQKHYRVFFQNSKNLEIIYGNQKWKRHESLAHIDHALVLELPDSSEDNSRLPQGFWNRLESDLFSLIDFVNNFIGLIVNHMSEPQQLNFWEDLVEFLTGGGELTKDAFGVHKLIFVSSKFSDVSYVLDSTDGRILHEIETPGVRDAQKVIVYGSNKEKKSSEWYKANSDVTMILLDHDNFIQHVYQISALNGDLNRKEVKNSNKRVQHILADLVIFEDNSLETLSVSVPEKVHFTRNTETSITGLLVENGKSEVLWKWECASGEKIIEFTRQDMSAKTHAIGRALNDRSIQYKYLNPHVAVIIIEKEEDESLGIYAIDTVTGNIIHTQSHASAVKPVKSAIIDNWITYTYWDVKKRRFHIESLEFYKGKASTFQEMKNFVVDTFSSSDSTDGTGEIRVIRQGYIVPFEPDCIIPTKTKKGITQRSLLISSKNSGMILSIPYRMLDARRIPKTYKYDANGVSKLAFDPAKVDDSYELPGAYYPEVVVNPETLISNNRTVIGIDKIVVSPADLESTCVAFATGGPDMFFTRSITPSRHFDRLEAGFAHSTLLFACIGLLLITFLLKHQSDWRQIKTAWT